MIILEHPLDIVLSVLGVKKKKPTKRYKMSKFNVCLDQKDDEGVFIFNTVSKAAIFLTDEEFGDILNSNEDMLYRGFFLVPDDYDEDNAIDKLKGSVISQGINRFRKPSTYTILPTTTCNARCFYCYESGRPQKVMTDEIAEKTANYIIQHHDESKEAIRLYWFGGEPTVNIRAIDKICEMLGEANVPYYSEMVSNGYLLNEENIRKGLDIWKLKSVQITVDGTKDIYNQSKNYIYKNDENPYETIMHNISLLLSNNIHVDIRLNVGTHNFENLGQLINELAMRFGGAENLNVYTMQIFECNMVNKRTDEEKAELFEIIDKLNKQIDDTFKFRRGIERTYNDSMCGADSGKGLLIAPDGHIGLCEHHTDDEFIGHIDQMGFDFQTITKWKMKTPKMDICENCPIWPSCIKLVNCPEEYSCSEFERDMKVKKLYRKLQHYYEDAKFSQYYINQIKNQK